MVEEYESDTERLMALWNGAPDLAQELPQKYLEKLGRWYRNDDLDPSGLNSAIALLLGACYETYQRSATGDQIGRNHFSQWLNLQGIKNPSEWTCPDVLRVSEHDRRDPKKRGFNHRTSIVFSVLSCTSEGIRESRPLADNALTVDAIQSIHNVLGKSLENIGLKDQTPQLGFIADVWRFVSERQFRKAVGAPERIAIVMVENGDRSMTANLTCERIPLWTERQTGSLARYAPESNGFRNNQTKQLVSMSIYQHPEQVLVNVQESFQKSINTAWDAASNLARQNNLMVQTPFDIRWNIVRRTDSALPSWIDQLKDDSAGTAFSLVFYKLILAAAHTGDVES
jgi:hypothetical protein